MAERKCVYDPLVEIMAYYADRKEVREQVDRATLTVEERLKQRIIDGDQIGLDADLAEALRRYPALEIINTFLLDGMKVVGELFGSGQMQLPFVLQSAETMKAAVAYLEPSMDKSADTAKGTMVLATVKGDVHDIGKNLVDIILTNNGYRVVNLGIKVPLETMLEAATEHRADAIGMSGLLVKSTAIMKENLELMAGRGLTVPVVLGGAALTRRFVEHDLRSHYANVAYAQDAFDGLRFMERIMAGEPMTVVAGEGEGPGSEMASGEADARRRRESRGELRTRRADELDDLGPAAEILGRSVGDSVDWSGYVAVELGERVLGLGRVREVGAGVWLIDDLSMLAEQAVSGAAIVLLRALRREARATHADADVLLALPSEHPAWTRMVRAIGFVDLDASDPRRDGLGLDAAAVVFISKPAGVLADESAAGMHEGRTGGEPGPLEDFETDHNVRRLRVTSDVDRTVPVPRAPFHGARIVDDVRIEKVFEYINEVALIRGQWQIKRGGRSPEEYRRQLEEVVYPTFEEMKLRAKREALLQPRVVYGYYPCLADGNQLVIYRPSALGDEALVDEWPTGALEAGAEEWLRFDFPRQPEGRHLCIADFFRPVEGAARGEFDVVAFQIVTMGARATEYANELFRTNNYADYLYFHGLSVESAEALAEYWHRSIRTELGIAGADAPDLRRLFSQGYQGSRYSFGYPACPNLEDQAQLFTMLRPERIGVALSDEYMLEPEQSTSAIVVHHPGARYFNIRE